MATLSALIPARFLSITSHLTVILTVFLSRDETLRSCMPPDFTNEQFSQRHYELTIGLSVATVLMLAELLGYVLGVTMFKPAVSVTSVLCHSTASVCLMYFLTDAWDCHMFWPVLAVCSIPPALVELTAVINMLVLKRGW